jgi:hypothetical protein
MDIIELLNRLATERLCREFRERVSSDPITYVCDDGDILAAAIVVMP